jgi:hypothetical protein
MFAGAHNQFWHSARMSVVCRDRKGVGACPARALRASQLEDQSFRNPEGDKNVV